MTRWTSYSLILALTLVLQCSRSLHLRSCYATKQVRIWQHSREFASLNLPRSKSLLCAAEDDEEREKELARYGMDKEDILQEEEYPMNPLDRYPENADDEAILNAMRMERMVANDRWQSTLFRDTVGGEWVGSYEAFSPGKSPTGDFELVPLCKGSVSCCVDAGDFETKGVSIYVTEEEACNCPKGSPESSRRLNNAQEVSPRLLQPSKAEFASEDFRISRGNQVVGSAFTTGSTYPDIQRDFQEDDYDSSVPEEYVAEVGLVDGPVRFRARWVYSRSATSPSLLPDPKSPAITVDNPDQETCLSLQAVVVFREARADMLQAPAVAALLSEQLMGSPIYDPPAQGAPFVQISLSGKLSLLFPTYLKSQSIAANSLTIDWTGPSMRYQADRKFGELTGKIRSLELTEILPQDEGKVSPDLFMPQLR